MIRIKPLALTLFACTAALLSAEDANAPRPRDLRISLTSFNDIVTDPVKINERVVFNGQTLNFFKESEHAELRLRLPAAVFRLWRDVIPALQANAPAGFEMPPILPPNLDQILGERDEIELSVKNVLEIVRQLRAVADQVASADPEKPELRMVRVQSSWVNDFLAARQTLAMAAMEASEINGGRVAVQDRGPEGVFVELGGSKHFRQMSTGDVPQLGPIYCAPFGKNGTWNLYQVVNKPGTWLQAQAAAEGAPVPLGVPNPAGGHLVSIHSAEENEFLLEIGRGLYSFWIGLNDRRLEAGSDPEGPWEWSSGEPVTWRNWQPGEPDSGGILNPREAFDDRTDEDGVICLGSLSKDSAGLWQDNPTGTFYPKNHRASYVIEWNVNSEKPIPGAALLPRHQAK